MSAGPKYEYLWADGHNVRTPLKVSAQEYIDFLMTWVENQLNNEKIFPCALGVPFPKNFLNIIKVITVIYSLTLTILNRHRVIDKLSHYEKTIVKTLATIL